jgi:hypothetical protein
MHNQLALDQTFKSGYVEMLRRLSYRKRIFMATGLTFALQSLGVLVINSKYLLFAKSGPMLTNI